MIIVNAFELTQEEIKLMNIAKNDMLKTNWTEEGKMQEKGAKAEQLVLDLLSLCDDVEVIRSKRSSALDEVLKVDIVARNGSEFNDVFAFQVKCSEYGAKEHFNKYGDEIVYKDHSFRTPWCLVVKDCYSPMDLLNLLIEELYLNFSLDLDKLEHISLKVKSSNGCRLPISYFDKWGKLSKKETKALRLIYNIGKNAKTYFVR